MTDFGLLVCRKIIRRRPLDRPRPTPAPHPVAGSRNQPDWAIIVLAYLAALH